MKSQTVYRLLLALLAFFRASPSIARTNAEKSTADYSKQIEGIFILDGAECAGFEFTAKELIWRNESACMYPDTFLIYWTDSKSFIAKEKKPVSGKPTRAPLIWFYTVRAFDGRKLVVDELQTGWEPFGIEKQIFRKASH